MAFLSWSALDCGSGTAKNRHSGPICVISAAGHYSNGAVAGAGSKGPPIRVKRNSSTAIKHRLRGGPCYFSSRI